MDTKVVTDKEIYHDKYVLAKQIVRAYEDLHDIVPNEMERVFNAHISKREKERLISQLSTRRVVAAVILENAHIQSRFFEQNEVKNVGVRK